MIAFVLSCLLLAEATDAGAAENPAVESQLAAAQTPSLQTEVVGVPLRVTPTGYVEAQYGFNFNLPGNGITAQRVVDTRHNTFTLANVALGALMQAGPVAAKLVLQVGSLPATYYQAEPALPGGGGVASTGPDLWRHVQEAFVAYEAPLGTGLLLQAGLFASPIGIEVIPIKDNWSWSRSTLFFAFPYYHAGLRATYEWTERLSTTVSLFNGWNSVVDNNRGKSVQANVLYKVPGRFFVQLLYFGGPERPTGAPDGDPWRHQLDLYAQLEVTPWLAFAAHGDAGFEVGAFGPASYFAGALYARVKPHPRVALALRADAFHERLARSGAGTSTPIFFGGVDLVGSATLTLEARPHDNIAVRLEYRHDFASGNLYFKGPVGGDGSAAAPWVPNARAQDTLLFGATAWF